jgi:thymidylate kinase
MTHLPNAKRYINRLLNKLCLIFSVRPDLIILLDLPAEVALSRLGHRDGHEVIQEPNSTFDFLSVRRRLFLSLVKLLKPPTVLTIIDANSSTKIVTKIALSNILDLTQDDVFALHPERASS